MRRCHCDRFAMKDGRAEPFVQDRDCRPCYLFATNREVNLAWGGDGNVIPRATAPARKRKRPTLRLPCIYEGPIIETCKTCLNDESRHVRICAHPNPSDPDRDKCTRLSVGPNVQPCSTCPDHDSGSEPSGPSCHEPISSQPG